jgi:hypothetical protein
VTFTITLRDLALAGLAVVLFGSGVATGRYAPGCAGPTPGPAPAPTPDVKPVDPVIPPKPVPVDPGPFAGKDGLRLLVVHETEDTMSPKLQSTLFGKATEEYLLRKCPKGVNGWPERRIWDQHTDPVGHGDHWVKAMAVPRSKLPFYVVGNGTSWEKGEVIADPQAFLTILKKYGGE